jgi:hypothetical protein
MDDELPHTLQDLRLPSTARRHIPDVGTLPPVVLLPYEITVYFIARIQFLTVKQLNGLFRAKGSLKTKPT